MRGLERTDYLASLEAGTLLMLSSDATGYVAYSKSKGNTLTYLPYLPPNYALYPAEELVGYTYKLRDFRRFAEELEKRTGLDCWEHLLYAWTFAYYTGIPDFSSEDVFLMTDGVSFQVPPLFNYEGAFCSSCDYEALRPPVRAFQCYWHFFNQHCGHLQEQPPHITPAINHFTKSGFYR